MTSQQDVFLDSEGDAWFARNAVALEAKGSVDVPLQLISQLKPDEPIASVLELGCSNGWRLGHLAAELGVRCVGVDPSEKALADGRRRFPSLELLHGTLADPPIEEQFDLVIVNFVLCWIDRADLFSAYTAMDALVRDGGHLVIGDFLPDHPQRRPYQHVSDSQVFTFKQDYAAPLLASNLYDEIARTTYDHDHYVPRLAPVPSGARAVCSILQRSLHGRFPLV